MDIVVIRLHYYLCWLVCLNAGTLYSEFNKQNGRFLNQFVSSYFELFLCSVFCPIKRRTDIPTYRHIDIPTHTYVKLAYYVYRRYDVIDQLN
jgi:hypothetical protein